jgi:hypothetical protein
MQRSDDVDAETAAYILQTQRAFEDLRQVAAQIAGLLVLNAAGANTATPDHPLLRSAAELHRGAIDAVHLSQPTLRARVHHRCLEDASTFLAAALLAAREGVQIDPVLVPLRRAYERLQEGSAALPGFEMVAFSQGCCGATQSMPRMNT